MWRRVALIRTEVSEERTADIIRMEIVSPLVAQCLNHYAAAGPLSHQETEQ
jgi:hypothetical protein